MPRGIRLDRKPKEVDLIVLKKVRFAHRLEYEARGICDLAPQVSRQAAALTRPHRRGHPYGGSNAGYSGDLSSDLVVQGHEGEPVRERDPDIRSVCCAELRLATTPQIARAERGPMVTITFLAIAIIVFLIYYYSSKLKNILGFGKKAGVTCFPSVRPSGYLTICSIFI